MVKLVKQLIGQRDQDGYTVIYQFGRWSVRELKGVLYLCGDVHESNTDSLNGRLYEIDADRAFEILPHLNTKSWYDHQCATEYARCLNYCYPWKTEVPSS